MVEPQPNLDPATVFARLQDIQSELYRKIEARFELHPDPSTKDLQHYSNADGTLQGSLNAFSGPEIDWLVHSWLGNPEQSNFYTLRLTTWLRSHIQVPHLVFEFTSRFPTILFYIDYIPRTDLGVDLEYLERYYEPVNQTFLTLQGDPRLSPFTSKSVFIRQFQSPVSLCYTCPATGDTLELIHTLGNQMLERWLKWVDEAERLPEEAQADLAERDLLARRSSAELDPGNQFAAEKLGQALTDRLVRSLWGGDRPTSS